MSRRWLTVVSLISSPVMSKRPGRRCHGGLWRSPDRHWAVLRATLIDHCTDDMAVVRDETFGPVLAIVRVEGSAMPSPASTAVAMAWGFDLDARCRSRRALAELLDVGVVVINNHALTGAMPALPWAARARRGPASPTVATRSTFARPKTTLVDRSEKPELYWPPYDRGLVELSEIL